jgi:hypothetical protein
MVDGRRLVLPTSALRTSGGRGRTSFIGNAVIFADGGNRSHVKTHVFMRFCIVAHARWPQMAIKIPRLDSVTDANVHDLDRHEDRSRRDRPCRYVSFLVHTERFLMNVATADRTVPISVVVNWTARMARSQ